MYVPFDRLAELDMIDQAKSLRRLESMPPRIVTNPERHAEQIRELRLLLSFLGEVEMVTCRQVDRSANR